MADIEHLQIVKASAADVYFALTTAKGLSEVWTNELTVHELVGAVNEFQFGSDDLTKMQIVELIPGERIEWLCVESDPEWVGTSLSFELEEKKGKTYVTFRQTNWAKVTDFYRSCNYNWAMFLYSLKLYCEEGQGMPFQRRKF
ncbi:SRPBCC domain-containing protein [Paenibacillus pinisoli]|uniref:SRPBCC domain-containing protein n=1 Tax=Paenibacillus pinisoli TaxID=1276110 RepID=A0A3A6PIC0_9BACL|nr:SRPBCC domain-containing protein [Paenibacillus pinisoli]RJX37999.1 SRPBCC domain-containing protein [Paenibacillus pinisoli]